MRFKRTALANGPVWWELEIPVTVGLTDDALRSIPADPERFEDTIDEMLGDVRKVALAAIETALEHVDDAFENEQIIELEGLVDPKERD